MAFVLLASLVATPALAFRIDQPIAVRITAYINDKPEGTNPDYDWLVADRKAEYRLYILKLLVTDGRLLPGDIAQAVEPYRIKFQLAGNESALQKVRSTPAGRQVVLSAYLRFGEGGRYMMLDTVEEAAAPTLPPTPPQVE